MQENDSAADDVIGKPCSDEDFSCLQLSWEEAEARRRLMRAFSNIRNPALRNIILDMVSALAWQEFASKTRSGAEHGISVTGQSKRRGRRADHRSRAVAETSRPSGRLLDACP